MGSPSDNFSNSLEIEFESSGNLSRATLKPIEVTQNIYGNQHCAALGALAELCAAHFITKNLGIDPRFHDCNLRRIEHEYHAVTKSPVTAVLEMDQESVKKIGCELAEKAKVKLKFDVELFDEDQRSIVSSSCEWLILRSKRFQAGNGSGSS